MGVDRSGLQVAGEDFMIKVANGYYKGSMSYPKAAEKPAIFFRRVDELTDEEAEDLGRIWKNHKKVEANVLAAREAYREEQRRLRDEFEADIAAYYAMSDHPKKDLLFNKAWEDGHANGYQSVTICYAKLLELVK